MKEAVNPQMILLARESRGLSQAGLARIMHISKASISRLEHGDAVTGAETLGELSEALGYPPQFFVQEGEMLPIDLSYRKRKKVPAKLITRIEAQINILRRQVHLLSQAAGHRVSELPVIPLGEAAGPATPEEAAVLLRQQWDIPAGPVENLVNYVESHGIVVIGFDFGTERVDSRSVVTANGLPLIFLNSRLLGDRLRFSLAFELGHLVMHNFCVVGHQRDINHEANRFAAALLMPGNEIREDFKDGITLPLLGELKRKWKVSMIALLYRADDIGLLTANQKRYLLQQFNGQKIRRREPPQLDVPPEKPGLLTQLVNQVKAREQLTDSMLATLLAVSADEYRQYYGNGQP